MYIYVHKTINRPTHIVVSLNLFAIYIYMYTYILEVVMMKLEKDKCRKVLSRMTFRLP